MNPERKEVSEHGGKEEDGQEGGEEAGSEEGQEEDGQEELTGTPVSKKPSSE
jgi:hypothetical protein